MERKNLKNEELNIFGYDFDNDERRLILITIMNQVVVL